MMASFGPSLAPQPAASVTPGRFDPRVLLPGRGDWLALALYVVGFAAMHRLAAYWGGSGFYSLWFPAAGLRLALLWRLGARLTPVIALIEILVDVTLSPAVLEGVSWTVAVWGIARPVLAYGATIAAIGWLAERRGAALLTAPMPFALALVLAPLVAVLSAVPQALTSPELTGVSSPHDVIVSLAAFAVGDLLGTLFIAPPLLWIADAVEGRAGWHRPLPTLLAGVETAGVLVLGLGLAELLDRAGLGMQPAPVLVAVAWIGLRFGRAAAWGALLVVVLRVLPDTAGAMDTPERLQRHLALATIVVTGYLAGSFADAQTTARAMLERRDRLLFQAERLKTLRAMSVAVIHEVSQPLSTLAIEARHLHRLTTGRGDEIAAGAALIDRKAEHLATLIRRLRRFGGHAEGAPQPLALTTLIDMVATLAETEAREAGVALSIASVDPGWQVMAQEIELAQAVMNLVRNAVQAVQGDAAPDPILIDVTADTAQVVIHVVNRAPDRPVARDGMGIGTHVARAIVEAHGGTLTRIRREDGMIHAALALPLIESR